MKNENSRESIIIFSVNCKSYVPRPDLAQIRGRSNEALSGTDSALIVEKVSVDDQ